MEYKDYMEKIPDDIVQKLNSGYGRSVEKFSVDSIDDKYINNLLCKVYSLISRSSAYFDYYDREKIKINNSGSANSKHKNIIKSMNCCSDYSIYEGYMVPRYLNMDRCYIDHYNCEIDILRILLLLLGLKSISCRDQLSEMAVERLSIINSVVLQG